MTTQYTSILKLALPVQGELSGTWGDVVNDNITSMIEEAIAGRSVINTWAGNSHTLTTADGTTAESRAAMLEFTDTLAALTGNAEVICPTASKIYIAKNAVGSSRTVTLKTSAGTGIAIPDGTTMLLFCDGTNVVEAVTNINSLSVGGYTVTLAGAVSTAAAFSTAGANALTLTTTGTTNVTLPTTGTLATLAGTETFTNKTLTSPDINGGTIDNATIGATTATTGVFTNLTANTNLTLATGATVTGINTTTDMSDASTTTLATSDSIKQYVDAQVGANNELSEVLANGNTTGSNNIVVDAGQSITTDSILETTAAAGVDIDGVLLKDTSVGTDDASGTDISGNNVTFRGGAGTGTGAGGSLVFQTAPAGTTGSTPNAQVTALTIDSAGDATFTGNANFGDNDKAIFGAGSDLQIYHDGSHSYVSDQGTGNLLIRGENVLLQKADGTENYFRAVPDAEVKIYYDGAEKLATTSTGIDVTGTIVGDGLTVQSASSPQDATISSTATNGAARLVLSNDAQTYRLLVNGTSSDRFQIFDGTAVAARFAIDTNGDISFYDAAGSSQALFWDASAESLGIGTTSPSNALEVVGNAGNTVARFYNLAAATSLLQFQDTGTTTRPRIGSVGNDLILDTANTERLRIDSSGNVGIGTSSISTSKLHLQGTTGTASAVRVESTAADSDAYYIADNDASVWTWGIDGGLSDSWVLSNAFGLGTPKMTVTTSGNVGIGTTSPAFAAGSGIEIERAGTATIRLQDTTNTANGEIRSGPSGIEFFSGAYGTSGDPFSFSVSGTKALTIDSSGNVGIGTTSPGRLVDLKVSGNTDGARLRLRSASAIDNYPTIGSVEFYSDDGSTNSSGIVGSIDVEGIGTWNGASNNAAMTFNLIQGLAGTTSPVEAMRIDSSGNLLVGTTSESTWESAAGFRTRSSGSTTITRDGNPPLYVNRLNSDGTILQFQKGTTVVGSIGTTTDNSRFRLLDTSNRGFVIRTADSETALEPSTTTAQDGYGSLGTSGARWKDLYLSGGVYVGGTGAANKLDDYEEGTWTPVYSPQTGAFTTMTMNVSSAKYTKVGQYVYVQASILTDNVDLTGASGGLRLSGLPFTSGGFGSLVISYAQNFGGDFPLYGYIENSTTYSNLRYRTSVNGADSAMLVSDLTTGAVSNQNYIIISGVYTVA